MTGSGSPCGACKFLRRKCVKGCVFAPYFCHDEGASHFAAIHKVFGASNVSKLLAHLPVSDRCEAAVTISYEAQARLQDPIYGCVSHIFALQQQVVNLQAQLASLKEQAARTFSANPSERFNGKFPHPPQDVQSWFQCENSSRMPQLDQNILFGNFGNNPYFENGLMNPNSFPIKPEENASFSGFEEASQSMDSIDLQTNGQWPFQDDANELPSMAFGYIQH
ncbi:LOB domain-containing protein [Actinidia chinensis var. chinensis]|uniref:LOB domain-containing protein n=1 Tax=Actinidia chinensis var. chinensis TaxID=1590841 RepID=A0A2R6PP63_ACTCC|nr:LOB domain-containing protein [Actinidia chinensis var. chinensis]